VCPSTTPAIWWTYLDLPEPDSGGDVGDEVPLGYQEELKIYAPGFQNLWCVTYVNPMKKLATSCQKTAISNAINRNALYGGIPVVVEIVLCLLSYLRQKLVHSQMDAKP
jgi:hypothetical protein